MQPHTKMEARIIENMAHDHEKTTASILAMERKWTDHLRRGGANTEAARHEVIRTTGDAFWFDRWISATGAKPLLIEWYGIAFATQMLAQQKAGERHDIATPAVVDLEQKIAKAAIAAAHLSAELWALSMTRLPEAGDKAA